MRHLEHLKVKAQELLGSSTVISLYYFYLLNFKLPDALTLSDSLQHSDLPLSTESCLPVMQVVRGLPFGWRSGSTLDNDSMSLLTFILSPCA